LDQALVGNARALPHNAVTNRPYSGCNVVLLWMAVAARKAAVAAMLAEGRKRRDLEAREINQAGVAYLYSHPQLFEEAAALIQRVPSLLKLSQRMAKKSA
jgi:antirestriction factor ArdC-like protein